MSEECMSDIQIDNIYHCPYCVSTGRRIKYVDHHTTKGKIEWAEPCFCPLGAQYSGHEEYFEPYVDLKKEEINDRHTGK